MPFVTINNHTLHYTDVAPSSSPSEDPSRSTHAQQQTLLMIHGLGSTQNYFMSLLPYLSTHRVVVFDNYGAGRSSYTRDTPTSIASIASDAIGLLDHLSISTAIIVGYSMGGMLPSQIAATTPERIRAGICIGPVHPSPSVAAIFASRVHTVRDGGMETMANVIPSAATGPRATALQKAFIREMLLAQDPNGYIANCHAIELAVPPEYGAVKVPMLIIAGQEDKSAPVAGCEHILSQLGSLSKRLQILPGVGHWHCVEAPDEVGRLMLQFIDELPV